MLFLFIAVCCTLMFIMQQQPFAEKVVTQVLVPRFVIIYNFTEVLMSASSSGAEDVLYSPLSTAANKSLMFVFTGMGSKDTVL